MPSSFGYTITAPPAVTPAASFLRLNGIAVPVAPGSSPTTGQEFIGKNRRAIDGTMIAGRRTTKGVWKFGSAIRAAAESLAFRDLILGRGHVLSFEALGLYTSQGMAPVSVGVDFTLDATVAKFGSRSAKSAAGGASSASWAMFSAGSPWTVAFWASDDGWVTGYHFVVRSDGAKWLSGVRNDALSTTFAVVAAGVLTLGDAAALWFDDVVALPFLAPDDWPPQMNAFGYPFGQLPALTADGEFIEQNTRVSVLGGEPAGSLHRGATVKNLHDFAFDLFEV